MRIAHGEQPPVAALGGLSGVRGEYQPEFRAACTLRARRAKRRHELQRLGVDRGFTDGQHAADGLARIVAARARVAS